MAAAALVAVTGGSSRALDVRVRWLPSTDGEVTGYNVYVRSPGSSYGAPAWAGLPALAADGTMATVLRRLVSTGTYYFAVSGYGEHGAESRLSNEVLLGEVNECTIDRCYTPTSCEQGPVPDGRPCDESGDPCAAACSAGICARPAVIDLATRRMKFALTVRNVRFKARANFVPFWPIEPQHTGLTLTFHNAAGTIIHRAVVSPAAIYVRRSGRSFRLHRGIEPGGIERLDIRTRRGTVQVQVRGVLPGAGSVPAALGSWSLTMGTQCAREERLTCVETNTRLKCE
jgi:hypothetical protein